MSRAVRVVRHLTLIGALASASSFYTLLAQTSWSRVGGTAIASGLAGLAGGPVNAVWYGANGKLLVRTDSGRVFETADFEHWQLNQTDAIPAASGNTQSTSGRVYRLGRRNLYVSENGRTWINLTGFNDESVVGGGATALAVSPRSQQELTIGNSHGLWRSLDSGLTWHGLNDGLPNFPVARLLGQRGAVLKDGTTVAWNAGAWVPVPGPSGNDTEVRLRASARLGIDLSAFETRESTAYSGTADGRLFVSRDGGATWLESPRVTTGAVARFWVDPDRPEVALAIAGNKLYRTINAGVFWDEVTGSMPEMKFRAVTADRSASVIYAATDRGVFSAILSLNDAGVAANEWNSVSLALPAGPAVDVQYNIDGTLTAALDGYGIYETQAPHRSKTIRILSGADLTERAAAPGSLVSVIGAKLDSARTGDLRYPLLLATDAGTQMQVPFESAAGVLTIAMEAGIERFSLPVTIKESAPAIFVDADGTPLILDAETGLVLDTKVSLHPGSRVQIMATGLGKVTPDWPTGAPAPVDSPPLVRGIVTAFLDGTPIEVTRATLAAGYVGYYTVELQLPQVVNRGANELTLVMNGEHSNRVKLYLEQLP